MYPISYLPISLSNFLQPLLLPSLSFSPMYSKSFHSTSRSALVDIIIISIISVKANGHISTIMLFKLSAELDLLACSFLFSTLVFFGSKDTFSSSFISWVPPLSPLLSCLVWLRHFILPQAHPGTLFIVTPNLFSFSLSFSVSRNVWSSLFFFLIHWLEYLENSLRGRISSLDLYFKRLISNLLNCLFRVYSWLDRV